MLKKSPNCKATVSATLFLPGDILMLFFKMTNHSCFAATSLWRIRFAKTKKCNFMYVPIYVEMNYVFKIC